MPTLSAGKEAARRAFSAADQKGALFIWTRIAERFPSDHHARVRIADTLRALGQGDLAARAYRSVAAFAARSGHPLPALVACRALEEMTGDADQYEAVSSLYSAGSKALGKRASRLSVDLGGGLEAADLQPEGTVAAIAQKAVEAATWTEGIRFPEALHPIPLLSSLPPDGFTRAAREARLLRLTDGKTVFREGDSGQSVFMVADGQVRVIRGKDRELARLGEGGVFGEMALLSEAPRSATVEVVDEADLFELGRDVLEVIGEQVPGVHEALSRFVRDRLLGNVMLTSPLFEPFSPVQRHELLARFAGLEVEPGTTVIRQGEKGRGLYVVASGEVEVLREQQGLDVSLARVGAGGIIGEIALLRDRPATATVTATQKSTLLFLEGELFRRLVAAVEEIRTYFEQLADSRLREVEMVQRAEVMDDFEITYDEG